MRLDIANNALAIANNTSAIANNASAIANELLANNTRAVAIENNTQAIKNNALSIGQSSIAINDNAVQIEQVRKGIATGVVVFETKALLDVHTPIDTKQESGSFKVTNDPLSANNGYYSWVVGTTYAKDYGLVNGAIASGEVDAVNGDAVFNLDEIKLIREHKPTSYKNLYDRFSVLHDKYIRTSDGAVLALANAVVSDFITIDHTKSYVFTSNVDLGLTTFGSVTFFAADKITVLGFGVYNNITGKLNATNFTGEYYLNGIKVTAPPVNAAYMVVQLRKNNISTEWEVAEIQIEEGLKRTGYDDKSPFITPTRGQQLESRDYGNWHLKKYASFGDSITWYDGNGRTGYQQEIIKRNGILDYENKGVSGETMAFYVGSNNDLISDVATYDFSLYDLITIAHGTNDFHVGVSIGDISSVNNADFYGAYNLVLTEIFAQNVNIRPVLMTPFQRTGQNNINSAGHTLKDYVEAIKAIGEKWGCPVIDNFANSGFNAATLATYTSDGLHPNNTGFSFAGKYIARQINAI